MIIKKESSRTPYLVSDLEFASLLWRCRQFIGNPCAPECLKKFDAFSWHEIFGVPIVVGNVITAVWEEQSAQ